MFISIFTASSIIITVNKCLPLRPFNIIRRTSASFRCINPSVRTLRASSHRSRRCLAGPLDGQNPTLTDLYQTSGIDFVNGKHLLRAISIPIWLVRKWDLNAPFRNPSTDMRLRSLPMRHSSRFLASHSWSIRAREFTTGHGARW
jgi:hypothetical protein